MPATVSGRRRRLTASERVSLAVTLAITAGVILLSGVAYLRITQRLSVDLDQALLQETDAFAAALKAAPASGRTDLIVVSRTYLQGRTGAGSPAILLMRFSDGRVLSNSDIRLEQAPAERALLDASKAEPGFSDVRFDGDLYRVATLPIKNGAGTSIAVYQAALPTDNVRDVATQLGWTLLATGLAVVIVGAGLSALVARTSLAPLRRAAETTEEISQRSLGRRVDYQGPDDEVGRMVGALNSMLGRLEAAFAEQRLFVADASHELRTPLAIASGHLEVLSRADLTEREREEEVALIEAEVRRMSRLVDDLLALARLDAGPLRPTQKLEMSTLAVEAAARARTLGDRVITTSCREELWAVGDPDQLEQVLVNLLRNAVDHTAGGGRIEILCRAEPGEVVLSVADDGPGIPEQDLQRIFDRFYRAPGQRRQSATGGSGLGLAITRRLVEIHGGTISAANRKPHGAVFTIRLPRTEAPRY